MHKFHYHKGAKITPREYDLLNHLAEGKKYTDAAHALGVTKSHARVILVRLRALTGVFRSTDEPQPWKTCLSECTDTKPEKKAKPQERTLEPSQMQTAVLMEIAMGKLPYQAAKALGIKHPTAAAHALEGIKRLGLTGLHGQALQEALAKHFRPARITMDDPYFN